MPKNDLTRREELHAEGWALGLRSVALRDWIHEHWEPSAAVAGPEETVEEEAPVEEPKPAKKKAAKKKAKKKS